MENPSFGDIANVISKCINVNLNYKKKRIDARLGLSGENDFYQTRKAGALLVVLGDDLDVPEHPGVVAQSNRLSAFGLDIFKQNLLGNGIGEIFNISGILISSIEIGEDCGTLIVVRMV